MIVKVDAGSKTVYHNIAFLHLLKRNNQLPNAVQHTLCDATGMPCNIKAGTITTQVHN